MGNAIAWIICLIYSGVMLAPGINAAAAYLLTFMAIPLFALPAVALTPLFSMFNTYPPAWAVLSVTLGFVALIGPVRAIAMAWRREPRSFSNVVQPAARWGLVIFASWEGFRAMGCVFSYSGAPTYCH